MKDLRTFQFRQQVLCKSLVLYGIHGNESRQIAAASRGINPSLNFWCVPIHGEDLQTLKASWTGFYSQ